MELPFYFVWIGAGLIALIILYFVWRNLDDEQKRGIFSFIWKIKIWIILIAIFIWGYNSWGFVSDSWLGRQELVWVVVVTIALVWNLGILFVAKMRYISTQAIADNRHGSCAKYQEIGDYVVLNIGSIDADYFPYSQGHETWVVPKEKFKKINRIKNSPSQIYCKVLLVQAELNDLPPMCKDFIESASGYNKNNIFYGEFESIELEEKVNFDGKDVKKRDLMVQLFDTQRLLNEQRAMTKGRSLDLKRYWSDHATIRKKMAGEGTIKAQTPEEAN